MCYTVLLSTTTPRDLREFDDAGIRFEPLAPREAGGESATGIPPTLLAVLRHPNRWYVASRSGCGCGLRHLPEPTLGFGAPEDWYLEDPDDVRATMRLAAVIRACTGTGESVDCVDLWNPETLDPATIASIAVDLATVPDAAFRLFENHHFAFAPSPSASRR